VNLLPDEPEVLVTVNRYGVFLWAARRAPDGNYIQLGSRTVAGPDSRENRGLGWVWPVDLPGHKGLLTAIEGGLNWHPISTFLPKSTETGWSYSTGGVPAVAALAEDIDGDGVPEVFLGRQDGFVNVFSLADGRELGLLGTGEPLLGMAMLKRGDGKPCLAVGTTFAVYLFNHDLKAVGRQAMPAIAFAGPGGKARDRAYVISAAGKVHVLILK